MARFLIPDSVAAEVHEREIPDRVIEGFPLAQQLALIDAFDRYNIDGDLMYEYLPDSKEYREGNGVGVIEVDDGRGHYYAIVYGPDAAEARREADSILAGWLDEDEDEDEDDDD